MPRAYRPQRTLILALSPLLADDAYLSMSKGDFVSAVMKATGGGANPSEVSKLYESLLDEAGVQHS